MELSVGLKISLTMRRSAEFPQLTGSTQVMIGSKFRTGLIRLLQTTMWALSRMPPCYWLIIHTYIHYITLHYIHIYTYICVCIHIHINICMHACMHACRYVRISTCSLQPLIPGNPRKLWPIWCLVDNSYTLKSDGSLSRHLNVLEVGFELLESKMRCGKFWFWSTFGHQTNCTIFGVWTTMINHWDLSWNVSRSFEKSVLTANSQ